MSRFLLHPTFFGDSLSLQRARRTRTGVGIALLIRELAFSDSGPVIIPGPLENDYFFERALS